MIATILILVVVALVVVVPYLKGKNNFAKNPEKEGAKFIRKHLRKSVPLLVDSIPDAALEDIAAQVAQHAKFMASMRRQSYVHLQLDGLRLAARAIARHVSGLSDPDELYSDVLAFHGYDYQSRTWKKPSHE